VHREYAGKERLATRNSREADLRDLPLADGAFACLFAARSRHTVFIAGTGA
jgi:hypothetical protein